MLALGELWPSTVNVKNHNHTALHIHHHTVTAKFYIFCGTAVEVQENLQSFIQQVTGHLNCLKTKQDGLLTPKFTDLYIIPQNNLGWKLHFHMSAAKTWATELHTQGKSAKNNSRVAFHGETLSINLPWVALIRDSASGIDLRERSWRMDTLFQRNNINKNTPVTHIALTSTATKLPQGTDALNPPIQVFQGRNGHQS